MTPHAGGRGMGIPLPRESEQRWYKVWGLKGEGPMRFGFYGDVWLGQITHWDGTTFLCDGTPECRGCGQDRKKNRIGLRWNGYIAGHSYTHKADCVVHLTRGACDQLLPLYQEKGTLRGLTVELYRKRTNKNEPPPENAPVWVKALGWTAPEKLPEPFPIEYSILRMYGLAETWMERKKARHVKPAIEVPRIAHGLCRPDDIDPN